MTDRSCIYYDPRNKPVCTECGSDLQLCMCANPDQQAHDRLNSPDGIVIEMIKGELDAMRKENPSTTHMLVALSAKVGELIQALIEHDSHQGTSAQQVMREAAQVAAVAIRVATDGDENFLYQYPLLEEDLPRGPVGGQ